MDLCDYIKAGILRKDGQKALADQLGLSSQQLTNAKAHRAGLPPDAAVKLAQLLNIDPLEVIKASELVTERKPEKRTFWENFEIPAKTARVAGILIFGAIVTNFVTTSPAEAAPMLGYDIGTICIM